MEATLPSGRRASAATSERTSTGSTGRELQVLVAALVIVLMPFPVILTMLSRHQGGYDFQALVFPSDVACAALVVVCAGRIWRDARRLGPVLTTLGVLLVLLVLAFVVHPADRGLLNLVRYAAALALAWVFATTRERTERDLLVGAVVLTAALQSILAFVQLIHRGNVGLAALGEFSEPFNIFGRDTLAPQGTMVHIYLLAGLALIASTVAVGMWLRTSTKLWLVAAAVCVAPVAVTYSRAAIVGFVAVLVALVAVAAVRRRPAAVAGAAVLAVTVGALILVWPDGWTQRVSTARTGRRSIDTLSTGRGHLMRQAAHLIADAPVIGVGTGRYVMELRDRHEDPKPSGGVLKPVHNVPLLAGAEAGVGALIAVVVLLLLLGVRAWTAGPPGVIVYLAYLPYTQLDHFPYSFPQGIVMTGIWVGVIELLARERAVRRAPATPA
jgi:hypothetical protein